MRIRPAIAIVERDRLPDLRQGRVTLLVLNKEAGIRLNVVHGPIDQRVGERLPQMLVIFVAEPQRATGPSLAVGSDILVVVLNVE